MKLGSLFDGSGGFPLAGSLCGIEPRWAAEVEPYPIAVTKSRFPNMKHLGSVTDINGAEVEPVDIITFGSPCQDLSVAGKRAGLKHEANGDDETTRSGLFMEAVRIIREMREATNGDYPKWAIWENVPGAFSSNKGEDFRIVLEELIKTVEPDAVMPSVPTKGWAYSDCYYGDGWSLAYRVLDAQFWGVPQRRRRIYLVLDLTGQRAGSVLFEREGLRGHFAESRATWQTAPRDAENCTGAADREGESAGRGLDAVTASGFNYLQGSKARGIGFAAEPGVKQQTYLAIPIHDKATRYQGGGPTRNCDGAGNGLGVGKPGDPVPTLSTCDRHMVAYAIENHPADSRVNAEVFRQGGFADYVEGEVGTLRASGGDYGGGIENILVEQSTARYIVRRLTPTECARLQGFPDEWGHPDQMDTITDGDYRFWLEVRKTHAAINGKSVRDYTEEQIMSWYNKLHTDSSEYKMWGNGIALPCALYVMEGIAEELR